MRSGHPAGWRWEFRLKRASYDPASRASCPMPFQHNSLCLKGNSLGKNWSGSDHIGLGAGVVSL